MKFTSVVSLFFAVHTVSAGQFITGPCQQDSDCNPFAGQAGCCERTQKKCRAVLSLTPGVQACGDGRTPNFDHGAKVVNIDNANAPATNTNTNTGANKASTGTGSTIAPGSQFITGACTADTDCASTCCERTQKICRAILSLTPGVQACGDGRTPNFDHGAKIVNIDGGNAAPAPATNNGNGANKSSNGAKPAQGPGSGSGTQFITGPCAADNDCASFAGQAGCCERTQKICRAVLSLKPGVQACGDGRTPNFDHGAQVVNIDGGKAAPAQAPPAANNNDNGANKAAVGTGSGKPLGTQFITGKCAADNECASTCCEKTSLKCRAPASLKSNVEFCQDGRTTRF